MRKYLEENDWEFWKTGCSCNGSPKYFRNTDYPGVEVKIWNSRFRIQKGDKLIACGDYTLLETKMKEHELIQIP